MELDILARVANGIVLLMTTTLLLSSLNKTTSCAKVVLSGFKTPQGRPPVEPLRRGTEQMLLGDKHGCGNKALCAAQKLQSRFELMDCSGGGFIREFKCKLSCSRLSH